MSAREIEVFTIGRTVRAVAYDTSKITFREVANLPRLMACQPIPGAEMVVDYAEPVHRLFDLDGKEHFFAMDHRTRELLSHGCDRMMRERARNLAFENEQLKKQVAELERQALRSACDAREWQSRWEGLIDAITQAPLLKRIKYLLTRCI